MGRRMHPWFRPGRGWYVELDDKQIRLTAKGGTEAEATRAMHQLLATRGVDAEPQAGPAGDPVASPAVVVGCGHFGASRRKSLSPYRARRSLRLNVAGDANSWAWILRYWTQPSPRFPQSTFSASMQAGYA